MVDAKRSGSSEKTRQILARGSIAYVSPLAHHLIGKQVGDAVEMDGQEIEIIAVE